MAKITLNIDGVEVLAEEGDSILEAALNNDIFIPHLCYHPELKPAGACRLCVVEVGDGKLVTSCRIPVAPGMVVRTSSPQVERARQVVVELLIADYHTDCRHCPATGHCELQRIMGRLRLSVKRMRPLRWATEAMPLDTSPPFFDYDPGRCVLCGICVQTCQGTPGSGTANFIGRGYATKIGFFGDMSQCESCGQCVARCPVGALIPKNSLTTATEPG